MDRIRLATTTSLDGEPLAKKAIKEMGEAAANVGKQVAGNLGKKAGKVQHAVGKAADVQREAPTGARPVASSVASICDANLTWEALHIG